MKDNRITMWTAQTDEVLETVLQTGVNYVKDIYIKSKYREAAWVFMRAYDYFKKGAEERIKKPPHAESPVWMYRSPEWAVHGTGLNLIELSIPEDEVVLFDLRIWQRILSLSYVGSEDEIIMFDKKLEAAGAKDPTDVFMKPYYPMLKRELIKSWDRIWDGPPEDERYTQGGAWCLKKGWIKQLFFRK